MGFKHDTGYFLVFFLMKSHNNLFFANIENHPYDPQQLNWIEKQSFPFIYDFRLENGNQQISINDYKKYKLGALILEEEKIRLGSFNIEFHGYNSVDEQVNIYPSLTADPLVIDIIPAKNYSKAIFKNFSEEFYFITYNNISDIITGYSINTTNDYGNLNPIKVLINEENPFNFIDDINKI